MACPLEFSCRRHSGGWESALPFSCRPLSFEKDYTESRNEWTITGKDGHKVEGMGYE